jgi:hypothetical protein
LIVDPLDAVSTACWMVAQGDASVPGPASSPTGAT